MKIFNWNWVELKSRLVQDGEPFKQPTKHISAQNRDNKPRYVVACATLSLVITIMIFVLGVVTVAMIDDIEEQTALRVEQLRDQQFNEIWGLITSAQHSAYLHSGTVRDRIVRAIERTYYTPELMEQLSHELSNPTADSQITQIFMNAIEGMYMYYNTNFNGMSVSVAYDIAGRSSSPRGYLAATYNNNFASTPDEQVGENNARLLNDIVGESYNIRVSRQYINHILAGPSAIGIIPFIQISYPGAAVMLESMDRYAVYNAFLEDGMSAFYGLVVSGSAYVFDREDVFGVPNIAPAGQPRNNHVIVITQHFRVADMLRQHHSAQIARYNLMIENAIADGVVAMSYRQVVFIFLIAFWLVFVIVIAIVQNSMAQKIELNYLRAMHPIPITLDRSVNDKDAQ